MGVLVQNGLLEAGFRFRNLLRRRILKLAQRPRLAHVPQHARRRLAAHHADAAVGPAKQKARVVGAAHHAVVARAVADAVEQRNAGHVDVAHGHHHLGPVLGDAAIFILPAHHEARNVLQKEQRRAPLAAQLDEVRGL